MFEIIKNPKVTYVMAPTLGLLFAIHSYLRDDPIETALFNVFFVTIVAPVVAVSSGWLAARIGRKPDQTFVTPNIGFTVLAIAEIYQIIVAFQNT
ncbi:hypothetical protein AAFN47_12615 [Hoeflea sp. CAU 1731]